MAKVEKAKFRYVEPPVDRSARSIVDKEEVVARPTYQLHDGTPYPPNEDEDGYRPVQLPTVLVYDPDADVFEKETAQPYIDQEEEEVHTNED